MAGCTAGSSLIIIDIIVFDHQGHTPHKSGSYSIDLSFTSEHSTETNGLFLT